jgi:hypothetical protein
VVLVKPWVSEAGSGKERQKEAINRRERETRGEIGREREGRQEREGVDRGSAGDGGGMDEEWGWVIALVLMRIRAGQRAERTAGDKKINRKR